MTKEKKIIPTKKKKEEDSLLFIENHSTEEFNNRYISQPKTNGQVQ
jgi:hypothetical protein